MAVLGVGAFHSYRPLSAVVALSGTLQAAYSAVIVALLIAAVRGSVSLAVIARRAGCGVVRRADATKQNYLCLSLPSLFRRRALIIKPTGLTGGPRVIRRLVTALSIDHDSSQSLQVAGYEAVRLCCV
jgi:hypothetical protein